jgi:ribosomal protein S4
VRKLVEQGGVRINGEKIMDPAAKVDLKIGDLIEMGKKKVFQITKLL